jgi:purine-binding chemotaxis protein CheW
MDAARRPGGPVNPEALQEALRAFGSPASGAPSSAAPTAEMAALAQRMGLPAASTTAGAAIVGMQYVLIRLNEQDVGFAASQVIGVERVTEVTPVPNTVAWVLGVANLRGAITSVVDLRAFLGVAPAQWTPASRIVVAGSKEMFIGFLVDGITEFRVLRDEQVTRDGLSAAAPPWLAPYAVALAPLPERRVLILDVERILATDRLYRYRIDSDA